MTRSESSMYSTHRAYLSSLHRASLVGTGHRMLPALLASVALLVLAAIPAAATPPEATFERTFSVNGSALQLTVSTGAGNIHLTRGSDNQVHVVGHVKANWGGNEETVRQIAANPPIEQTGNIVRIGAMRQNWRGVSISYDIEAPGNAFLNASSGSGNINDDGVGENATLHTGSGNIHATGLGGGFTASTGSGDIYAEQAGQGDAKANTGSGNIELRNLYGGLTARTGSGNIKLGGTPASLWHVQTGSGNVEFWPGSKGFNLNASTGSGDIRTDHSITGQIGNRHHVTGSVNGGGPEVRMSTGSGDIRVH